MRTNQDNACYIETKNLDGETNLKHKSAPLETVKLEERDYIQFQITCENPSDKIYQFDGVLKFEDSYKELALSYENFALRGSSLKNTEFVVGLVAYTGHNTRIMRNSVGSKQKQSHLEAQTGR